MSNKPYATDYSLNTNVRSADYTTLLTGATSNPTASGGYARYQRIGNMVQFDFKYIFATAGSGVFSINLPIPISTTYTKPQGFANLRYIGTGTGQVHICYFNEKDTNSVNIVASTTYGGVPAGVSSGNPLTGLGAGDILTGAIFYEST
jgi:hypothetical protein